MSDSTDDKKTGRVKLRADVKDDVKAASEEKAKPREQPRVGPGNEPEILEPEEAVAEDEGTVAMIFPKEVVLTDDNHKRIRFPAGLVAVPAHLADHWFLEKNGVKRADRQRPKRAKTLDES